MKLLVLLIICICATIGVPIHKIMAGRQTGGNRIVNGSPASPGQFPYQVAIYMELPNYLGFCGGALISADYVLTAAHCVSEIEDQSALSVYVGITDLNSPSNLLTVSEYIMHPEFNPDTLFNDIAVLKLTNSLVLNDLVQVIALNEEVVEAEIAATLSGWGQVSDSDSSMSSILNYVDLTTITNEFCKFFYGQASIPDSVICTDSRNPPKSACNGDSGGPLIITDSTSGMLTHVGIVSFVSYYGCESGYPTGFTRTAYYRDWIRENTGV